MDEGKPEAAETAVQVTIYLNESDRWHGRPAHVEILRMLRAENAAGACAFHAVAGFNGRSQVHTTRLVDAGGDLPVVILFVDREEHVERLLPRLFEMAPHRLIVRERVTIEQGGLD
jgi:PII-like signaling protein